MHRRAPSLTLAAALSVALSVALWACSSQPDEANSLLECGSAGDCASATAGSGGASGDGGAAGSGGAGGAAAGACTDDADAAIVAMKDATAMKAQACGGTCFIKPDEAACAADCMKTMAGFSDACATCWGNVIACGIAMCGSECLAGSASPGCLACTGEKCAPAFDACAGVP